MDELVQGSCWAELEPQTRKFEASVEVVWLQLTESMSVTFSKVSRGNFGAEAVLTLTLSRY